MSTTNPTPRITAISGNPRPGSRTSLVARVVAGGLAARWGAAQGDPAPVSAIELADHVGITTAAAEPAPARPLKRAVAQIGESDLLVIASPAWKGTVTALLKVLFEQFGPTGLAGRIVIPVAVAGQADHGVHVVEEIAWIATQLGAVVPTDGLVLLEADLPQLEPLVDRRIEDHGSAVDVGLADPGVAA